MAAARAALVHLSVVALVTGAASLSILHPPPSPLPTSLHTPTHHATTQHAKTQHANTPQATTQHANTPHATTQHANTPQATTQHANTPHATTQHATTQHATTQHTKTQHATTQHVTSIPHTPQLAGRTEEVVAGTKLHLVPARAGQWTNTLGESGPATTRRPRGQSEVAKRFTEFQKANSSDIKVEHENDDEDDDYNEGGGDGDYDDMSLYDEAYDLLYKDDMPEYELMPVAMALSSNDQSFLRYDGTYVVNDDDGYGCVLAYFKAKATIYYADNKGDYQQNKVRPNDEASSVDGICDRSGQVSEVRVSWSSYSLALRFGLDDITDSWFVSKFTLTYDLGDSKEFPNAAPGPGGNQVIVSSGDGKKYWQTNNARSFRCLLLHDIPLSDQYNNTATLHFDEVRVQAFSASDRFRTPKHCMHRRHRDEMVPVMVGGMLAASSLITVAGYGIFRYFKVKKFTYDTME